MKLCMVGTGYVGLVAAACFAEMGNHVVCVDVNPRVVASLAAGKLHIYEPGLEELVRRGAADGRLRFTCDPAEALAGADMAFICVGTPPGEDGSCDLQYVVQAARDIGKVMSGDLIVVDKSTVPVGTADKVREALLETLAARDASWRVDVVSNPEFLKEGDAINDFMKPDRVVVGTESDEAAEKMRELYTPFARARDKFIRMGVRSAEMTKYAANCLLAAKISFINEIAGICEQVGADVRKVRAGIAADQRIGHHFIYPGMGYGGSCFPKDVKALIRTAHEAGSAPKLLESIDAVNDRQKRRMGERIAAWFEPRGGAASKTLAVWGLAFKANTDDVRESAPLVVIDMLSKAGMRVRAFDPVAGANARALYKDNPLVEIVDEQYAAVEGADALLVATEWNQFRAPDFERLKTDMRAPIIFDGRNLYNPRDMARRNILYFCVGRETVAPS